jgi:hypothetical protein
MKKLAEWMVQNGFATGHGDTMDDLLEELDWQIKDIRARLSTWHRISRIIRTADNSNRYSGLMVVFEGKPLGTLGNLLVEMTPLPVSKKSNVELTGRGPES